MNTTGAMSGMGGIQLAALATALGAAAAITAAVLLGRRARRTRRIQLPANLLSRVPMPPGYLLTVEYPGPDGAPLRATVLSALRRGIGATPVFQGWVWVNVDNPTDVIVRPHARMFWPTFLGILGGFLAFAAMLLGMITLMVASAATVFPPPA